MFVKKSFILLFSVFTFALNSCSFYQNDDSSQLSYSCDILFLMYMDGDNNLNNAIWQDLNEVERGLSYIRNEDGAAKDGYADVKVIALWDGDEDSVLNKSCIYDVGADFSSRLNTSLSKNTRDITSTASWIKKGEVDMGSSETLKNFILWAKDRYDYDKIILQISNHGGGPGASSTQYEDYSRLICADDTSSSVMSTQDTGYALYKAGCKDDKIDLILFDLCLESNIEEAYEIKDYASYMVASANNIPGSGFNYTELMTLFTEEKSVMEFGSDAVDIYSAEYESCNPDIDEYYNYDVCKYEEVTYNTVPTLSLIDLSKIDGVKEAIDGLCDAVLDYDGYAEELCSSYLVHGRSVYKKSLYYSGTYVELYDTGYLMDMIINDAGSKGYEDVKSKALSVKASLKKAVIKSFRNDFYTEAGGDDFYTNTLGQDSSFYGLTISGKTHKDYGGCYPPFYDYIAFGKECRWADILASAY